jgi:hypothetical protein
VDKRALDFDFEQISRVDLEKQNSISKSVDPYHYNMNTAEFSFTL